MIMTRETYDFNKNRLQRTQLECHSLLYDNRSLGGWSLRGGIIWQACYRGLSTCFLKDEVLKYLPDTIEDPRKKITEEIATIPIKRAENHINTSEIAFGKVLSPS